MSNYILFYLKKHFIKCDLHQYVSRKSGNFSLVRFSHKFNHAAYIFGIDL